MERIDYNSSLKGDFKDIKTENRKADIFISSGILFLLTFVVGHFGLMLLSSIDTSKAQEITIYGNLVLSLVTSAIFAYRAGFKIKKRKDRAKEAEMRIDGLAKRIIRGDDARETNYMPTITDKNSLMESLQVEIIDYDEETKNIITDFYSLDNEDKLLVLREVRKNVKRKLLKDQEENLELYVLDEEDLPEELPVVRRLEVIHNEKN